MSEDIMVSVRCLCYNHEKYLRRALDGILAQKTNFRFEVIIHDDASTDSSQDIIREYAQKYPDIFVPILQKENLYSKDRSLIKKNVLPLVRGKYSAMCECDDYWSDPYKLQTQVDFLEKHPEYSICGHAYDVVNEQEHLLKRAIRPNTQDHEIPIEDVIMNHDLPQTATLVYRADEWKKMPAFFSKCMVGDYPLMLYMATCGKMYYFHKEMSCYRRHEAGSWVSQNCNNPQRFRKHIELINVMLDHYNEYTEGKYEATIRMRQENCNYKALVVEENIKGMIHNAYFQTLSKKEQAIEILRLLYHKMRKNI